MSDLIRDAPIGQIVRYLTKNRVLLYPEERPDFEIPPAYLVSKQASETTLGGTSPARESAATTPARPASRDRGRVTSEATFDSIDLEKALDDEETPASQSGNATPTRIHTRRSQDDARSVADNELTREKSTPIVPQRTSDGTILVDWYTTDDPANPHNWTQAKKAATAAIVCIYTLSVYMGSSIYTPSEDAIVKELGVSIEVASLGLALYVLAYGTGPLLFSPLSEIPAIGRNPPYMVTMGIFVILCVPAALVDNIAGLLVLRFLQGFFGSPCLATGGASLSDLYSLIKLPYALAIWALAATCGPAFGPLISGFSVTAENWHWSLWEMLWLAGPVYIAMMLFLPETSTPNILLRRARRLRKLTGNTHLLSQSEIDQASMQPKAIVFEALVRPMQLMVMDPAIGFTALYVSLTYSIYYSFFEAFPLVYIDKYGFNLGEMGLTFLSITVGIVLSIMAYYSYLWWIVEPGIRARGGIGPLEHRLIPALFGSFLLPIGLFIFGWTGNGYTPWIVSVVGICIFTMGVFMLMQCVFIYLPMVYVQYAASLFAGNDFARSSVAIAAVLFSRPMYQNLGIGPGSSLLGGLTAGCIGGIFVLYFYGAKLRAKSRFTG